jgi:replication factor C small subunit
MEELPWVEKHRPNSLDEIAGHDQNIQILKLFVKKRSIPHLILSGPAGTGKTSTAVSLTNDALKKFVKGDPQLSGLVVFRNASEENRIKDVDEIKRFVFERALKINVLRKNEGYNYYKFVILDESDNMGNEAQRKYRRIIEKAPPYVKFIFICNFPENIIDPIVSRCAVFRFNPLSLDHVVLQLKNILNIEGIKIKRSILSIVYEATNGDLRSAVNSIQTISYLSKSKMTEKNICDFFGILTSNNVDKYIEGLVEGKYTKILSSLSSISELFPRNFLIQVYRKISKMDITIDLKKSIWRAIGESDYRITETGDEKLHLYGLSGEISKIMGDIQ